MRFSTGIGSTDMAAGMATEKLGLKVPGAIKFVLKNKPAKWISGKDVILHIIGKLELMEQDICQWNLPEMVFNIYQWMTDSVL